MRCLYFPIIPDKLKGHEPHPDSTPASFLFTSAPSQRCWWKEFSKHELAVSPGKQPWTREMGREEWLGHDEGVASVLFRERRQSVGRQGEVRMRINKGMGRNWCRKYQLRYVWTLRALGVGWFGWRLCSVHKSQMPLCSLSGEWVMCFF